MIEWLILGGIAFLALRKPKTNNMGVSSTALTAGMQSATMLGPTVTAPTSRTRLTGTAIPKGPTPTPPSYPQESETYDPAYSESVEINSSQDPDSGYAITGNIGTFTRSDD